MVAYANLSALMEQLPAGPPPQPGQMPQPNAREMLSALGLFQLKAAVMGVRILEDGVRSEGLLMAPAPRQGILKAFGATSADLTPPAFVGENAAMYSAGSLDAPAIWTELLNAVQRLNPMLHQMLLMQLNNPQVGINFRTDVIDALGNRWFTYEPGDAGAANRPRLLNRVVVIDLKNASAMEGAFLKFMAMQGRGQPEKEQYEGHTIYTLPQAQATPAPGTPQIERVVAFMDDRMIVATNLALTKDLIRDAGRRRSPLLGNRDYAEALKRVLADPDIITYTDERKAAQFQWNQAAQAAAMTMGLQLPSWESISKYSSVSVQTWKWTADGLRMKTWKPFPQPTQ